MSLTGLVAFPAAALRTDWGWGWGLSGPKQENQLEGSGYNPLEVTRVVAAADK